MRRVPLRSAQICLFYITSADSGRVIAMYYSNTIIGEFRADLNSLSITCRVNAE